MAPDTFDVKVAYIARNGANSGGTFDLWLKGIILDAKSEALETANRYERTIEYLCDLLEVHPIGEHGGVGKSIARLVPLLEKERPIKWQSEPPKRLPSTLKSGKR